MELPFTIVFEPPSRSELRALLRMRGHWAAGLIVALTIGAAYVLSSVARADAVADHRAVPLLVTSTPGGAAVWVDGHQQGMTPIELPVAPGEHDVQLKTPSTIDTQYALDVGPAGKDFDAVLWRRAPAVTHLRPTLPGAVLRDVRLLDTGELGLALGLPPGRQIEAWALEPRTGAVRLLMDAMPGAQVAFASDGRHLAFLGADIGPPARNESSTPSLATLSSGEMKSRLNVVWLFDARAGLSGMPIGWRAPLEPAEQLVDVSWSPKAERLLVVASEPLPGGASRSRAWFVDADGQHAEPALTLPSDVAPGSAVWSPNGTYVAFVAHAAQINALCLLGVDDSFRYVADLDSSAGPLPGPPPLSWSPDGQRMVFVAPHQRAPGAAFDWLAPSMPHAIYLATVDGSTPTLLADATLDEVTWREDGQLLGLSRAGPDAPLGVRMLNSSGERSQDLVQLPLKPGASYSATWDLSHAEVLVSSRNSAGASDYWLAQLGADDAP